MDTKTKISLFVIASLIITIATITGPSVFAKLTTSSTTTDVSMHITEAIKALRSGDIQGAKRCDFSRKKRRTSRTRTCGIVCAVGSQPKGQITRLSSQSIEGQTLSVPA